jgi:hypothetical protein
MKLFIGVFMNINEALPLYQAKEYTKISGGKYKTLYDELFKGKNRIYFDIKKKPTISKSVVYPLVKKELENNGYSISEEDYIEGKITDPNNEKARLKIGRVLNKLKVGKDIINSFSQDPVRTSVNNLLIVISRHPYDLAGMSTDRDWDSCMEINTGSNRHYVEIDIEEGTIIAYLISKNDRNINRPYSRILIKPYSNSKNEIKLGVSTKAYGVEKELIRQETKKIIKKFNGIIDNVYERNSKLYPDGDSEVLTMDKYDKIDSLYGSDGIFRVQLNDKFGIIDKTGKEITELKYDDVWDFNEGYAVVKLKDKWGYIDETGKEITEIKYDSASNFQKGYAIVQLNDKWGLINQESKELIQPKYDDIWDFKEGYAVVKLNGKQGYINETGKEITEIKYDSALSFKEGYARVQLNDKWGSINQEGKEITEIKYDHVWNFKEGYARVQLNDKWGLINQEGKEITEIKYDHVWNFQKGYARVQLNDKWGYIDETGKEITELKYDDVWDFNEGYARVQLNDKWGYIDETGKEITELKYDDVWDFKEGYAVVKLNGKYGCVDETGKEVIQPKYSEKQYRIEFQKYINNLKEKNNMKYYQKDIIKECLENGLYKEAIELLEMGVIGEPIPTHSTTMRDIHLYMKDLAISKIKKDQYKYAKIVLETYKKMDKLEKLFLSNALKDVIPYLKLIKKEKIFADKSSSKKGKSVRAFKQKYPINKLIYKIVRKLNKKISKLKIKDKQFSTLLFQYFRPEISSFINYVINLYLYRKRKPVDLNTVIDRFLKFYKD